MGSCSSQGDYDFWSGLGCSWRDIQSPTEMIYQIYLNQSVCEEIKLYDRGLEKDYSIVEFLRSVRNDDSACSIQEWRAYVCIHPGHSSMQGTMRSEIVFGRKIPSPNYTCLYIEADNIFRATEFAEEIITKQNIWQE